MFTHDVYLIYKSKQDLALNNLQCLIWHKTKQTYKELFLTFWIACLCLTKLIEIELFLHITECKQKLYLC